MKKYLNRCVPLFLMLGIFACSNDTGMNPDISNSPTLATFSSIQANIFTPRCATSGCHNGSERPNLSSTVAYNNIVNVRSTQGLDYVEPGDANNSYLYRKLIGSGITGDRMPRGQAALSQAVTDSIKAWIQNGALNN